MSEESRTPSLWHMFAGSVIRENGLFRRVVLAILVAASISWWQWDKTRNFLPVPQILAWLERRPIPQADPTRFCVMVAHLENDTTRGQEQLIVEALKEFEGVQVLMLDRTIPLEGPVPEKMEKQGQELALRFLNKSGASVLIWGTVLVRGDRRVPKLYWTASGVREPKPKRYDAPRVEDQLRLPELMWSDLSEILGLLVASSASDFTAKEGDYVAGRLPLFIDRVRKLLRESEERPDWDANACDSARSILANALSVLGDQSRKIEALQEAVAVYREALKQRTRDRVPLVWAATQNNLGNALRMLGERESGTGRLEEAVAAYREALKERTFDRVPLDWAVTQGTLHNALGGLAEGQSGTGRLEEAVAAYREALKERTRDRVPLDWAMTQSNLCNALTVFGERESGTGRLEEAVVACKAALDGFESTHATHYEEFTKATLRRAEALFQKRRK